jgi:hypothetical protein
MPVINQRRLVNKLPKLLAIAFLLGLGLFVLTIETSAQDNLKAIRIV